MRPTGIGRIEAALFTGMVLLQLLARPSVALAQPVFRTEIGIVVLQATVKNERGEAVTDLDRGAFAVYENGKPQTVTAFSREDVPVSLGIALDHSRSMGRTRADVQAAALALVRASNPQDEVFLLNFADKPTIAVPFTSDVRVLEEGVGRVECIGGTALRDAVVTGAAYLAEHAARERKVLLVISDGNDNASAASRDQVREEARRSAIVIHVIALLNDENPAKAGRGREELDDLAGETGGLAYYPRTVEEVGAIALDLARQIRSQYTIAYSPVNQALDGSYRKIRVVAKGAGRLSVRTRAGYRATPGRAPLSGSTDERQRSEKQSPASRGR
jgi:Ca-activated chloride channel homolog